MRDNKPAESCDAAGLLSQYVRRRRGGGQLSD